MATGGVYFVAPLSARSGLAEEIVFFRAAGRPRPGRERRPACRRSGIGKMKRLLSDRPQPGAEKEEEIIVTRKRAPILFHIYSYGK